MPNDPEKEEQEVEAGSHPVAVSETKGGRRAFNNVRRELSEEELAAPAAHRLLLDMIDRLEDELRAMRHFPDDFHRVDKEAAVLKEKLQVKIATEVMSSVCLSVGFGLIGIVKNLWVQQPYAWIILVLAIILVLGGIAVKVIKR